MGVRRGGGLAGSKTAAMDKADHKRQGRFGCHAGIPAGHALHVHLWLLIQLDPGLVADAQQGAGLPLSCRPIGNVSPWMGQDRRSRRAKVESPIAPGEK